MASPSSASPRNKFTTRATAEPEPVAAPPKQRRAFTGSRVKAPIETGGDPAFTTDLARCVEHGTGDADIARSYTHAIHTYPARMHPATARAAIELIARAKSVVLDPFCGSGTTMVEARRIGAHAIGVDANPLAVLIARAKTWTAIAARRAKLDAVGGDLAADALAAGKAARRAGYEERAMRAPRGADPAVRNRRLHQWFAPHVRRELEHIAGGIDEIAARDQELADVLLVVLSSILYKVSCRASDTDPSRVERRIGRGAAARLFGERVDALCKGLNVLAGGARAPMPQIRLGDARELRKAQLSLDSVDAIVTSPPYAGTYDYTEQHRLRLDFLGLPVEEFAGAEIGSRRGFGGGDAQSRRRARRVWERSLAACFEQMSRVLRADGRAIIMLGDSVAGGRAMLAQETMAKATEGHLTIVAWASQRRPLLGAMERKAFETSPKREYVFLLTK